MILQKDVKYSYPDIAVVPKIASEISHRAECIPFDNNGMLPIFTAPMTSVVGVNNYEKFEKNLIYPILPRAAELDVRLRYSLSGRWAAYSLSEFINNFVEDKYVLEKPAKVLLDIANGHMLKAMAQVRKAKQRHGKNLKIMFGNIANPETYSLLKSDVDYVRVGIGTGYGCITSSNTAIHYPIASLINEIAQIRRADNNPYWPKIVADGGIRGYADVIKAIALGADYVMIGGLFSSLLESSSEKTAYLPGGEKLIMGEQDRKTWAEFGYINVPHTGAMVVPEKIVSEFYGMASSKGQIDLGGSKTRTSEGIVRTVKVSGTLGSWRENMTDYLRSAMSYTGVKTLEELRTEAQTIVISPGTQLSVNK